MPIIPAEVILVINAALLLLSGILTIFMIRAGVHYTHGVGDSTVQDKQKKIILLLLMLLFVISLLAAMFNIFISSI